MKYFDTGGFILGRGLAGVTAAAVRSAVQSMLGALLSEDQVIVIWTIVLLNLSVEKVD